MGSSISCLDGATSERSEAISNGCAPELVRRDDVDVNVDVDVDGDVGVGVDGNREAKLALVNRLLLRSNIRNTLGHPSTTIVATSTAAFILV